MMRPKPGVGRPLTLTTYDADTEQKDRHFQKGLTWAVQWFWMEMDLKSRTY